MSHVVRSGEYSFEGEAVSGWCCLRWLAGDAAIVELTEAIVRGELCHRPQND